MQQALRKQLAVQANGEGGGWSYEITALAQYNLEHKWLARRPFVWLAQIRSKVRRCSLCNKPARRSPYLVATKKEAKQ